MPTNDIENPLDDNDFDTLEKTLAQAQKIDRAIQKAKRAGLVMDDAEARNKEVMQKARAMIQTYRPG